MKIRATLVTLTFSIFACVPLAFSQDAPKKKMNIDPNKPAGEAFKNVQVLKDVPAGQFLQYMRVFTASLGVECNFCHVQGDRAADTKEEKLTARKMITMTHDINAQFFNGKMEVRCYTCHKGVSHPVSEPPAAGN